METANEINPIIKIKKAAIPSIKISKLKICCELKVMCISSEVNTTIDKITAKKDPMIEGMYVRYTCCDFPLENNPNIAPKEKNPTIAYTR